MLKNTGFTLTELLITMAILGVVGVSVAPSFRTQMNAYQLKQQSIQLYDTILQARNQSLSKRVCPTSTKAARSWGVNLDNTNQNFSLTCEDIDGTLEITTTININPNATLEMHPKSSDNSKDTARIDFLTQTTSSEIFFEGTTDFEDDIRITLSDGTHEKAICLNYIQAFPTVNQEANTCP